MGWSRQTAASKDPRLHSKVTTVFLNKDVSRHLACAKQAVFALIQAHRLVNSMLGIGMAAVQFPACLLLDDWKVVGGIAVHFVGGGEDECRIRTVFARRL